jgi:hypothetical protein
MARTDLGFIACVLVLGVVAMSLGGGARAFALCGDLSGDGHVTARDALGALRLSVTGSYDAGADVYPENAFDGAVTASDAARVLRSAAAATIPRCAGAEERAIVATTSSCDFVTGGVAEIDLASRAVVRDRPAAVAADAVVRVLDDRVFVLNRFGSNTVVELDPGDLGELWECSVGAGADPHDIVLAGPDKGYVTRFDSTKLAIVDPSAGPGGCAGFLTGTIDLGPWADADGFPEMDQMALVDGLLFVSIQRLDRNSFFRPAGAGAVLIIDTSSDAVVDEIELAIENPLVETKGIYRDPRSGLLWLAGPGRLFDDLTDGGIELIDPHARASLGVVATGADLGGDLTDLAVVGSARAYAIVAGEKFHVSVVEIDLQRRERVAVLADSDGLMSDIELTETGELWLADRNCFDPGARVFSIADDRELTEAPINPGLGPFNFELVR